MVEILIDDRERNIDLIDTLSGFDNVTLRKQRLPLGDFQVNFLLIERKTISDFCDSLCEGRLFNQATRLAQRNFQSLFIIEGNYANFNSNGVTREAVQGALVSLALVFKIPALRSLDPQESAKLVYFIGTQVNKRIFPSKGFGLRSGIRRLSKKEKAQHQILQGFPGIGSKYSDSLLKKFGTLKDVFNANVNDLTEIPGIGKRTARRLFDTMH